MLCNQPVVQKCYTAKPSVAIARLKCYGQGYSGRTSCAGIRHKMQSQTVPPPGELVETYARRLWFGPIPRIILKHDVIHKNEST